MGPWATNDTQYSYDPASFSHKYNTSIEYECDLGMVFDDGSFIKEYSCQWDGTWDNDPNDNMPACVCKFRTPERVATGLKSANFHSLRNCYNETTFSFVFFRHSLLGSAGAATG